MADTQGLMNRLKRCLFGRPPTRIDHPVFGSAVLIETARGSCWELETEVDGRAFTVTIETAGTEPPSDDQARFFQRLVSNPAEAFARARPLLVPEFERWTRQPFPARWEEAFEWVGLGVPKNADEVQGLELSFECLRDRGHHLFTCEFECGVPVRVQIDG